MEDVTSRGTISRLSFVRCLAIVRTYIFESTKSVEDREQGCILLDDKGWNIVQVGQLPRQENVP